MGAILLFAYMNRSHGTWSPRLVTTLKRKERLRPFCIIETHNYEKSGEKKAPAAFFYHRNVYLCEIWGKKKRLRQFSTIEK